MRTRFVVIIAFGFCCLLVLSCEKSKEKVEERAVKKKAPLGSVLEGEIPFRDVIERAGYLPVSFGKFPAEEMGKKGRIILYKEKKSGRSGGIIYLKEINEKVYPCWHWFFNDASPGAVSPVEVNEDGLWDLEVEMADGTVRKLIQEETFTLFAGPREDWLALNGVSSPTSSSEHSLWKCFDGDTATTWRSSLKENETVYIEVRSPFGVKDGVLMIRTTESEQPKNCVIYADGKKVKSFKLKRKEGEQIIHLTASVQGAKVLRLVVESGYDKSGFVSIAEFSLM